MKIFLWRRRALMFEDGAFSHKRDYINILKDILNLEGTPNPITTSRVIAIFLNGWILPLGGASSVEGLRSMRLPCLVYKNIINIIFFLQNSYLHNFFVQA